MPIIWQGTTEECLQLLAAVDGNCSCIFDFDATGARVSVCEAHMMLVQDQRVAPVPSDSLSLIGQQLIDLLTIGVS